MVKSSTASLGQLKQRFDRRGGAHLYRQIETLLQQQIRQGMLKPGETLPTQRQLSRLWDIGEVTIRRAFQALAEDGWIAARPGAGTVVCDATVSNRVSSSSAHGLTLGVACADLADGYPFFKPILSGLREDNCDVAVRLFDLPIHGGKDEVAGDFSSLADLDGLLMMSPVNVTLLAESQRRQLPTVLLFSDLADGVSQCILPDYGGGVMQAVSRMVAAGRRRIAMVTAGVERFSTGRWLDAYRTALQAFDLPADNNWITTADYTEFEGARATRELLALRKRPDAILFASDFMARGGLLAAHEAGVSVPDELAIVGAGPVLEQGGWTVPLATIDLGLTAMGRLAREAVEAAIAGQPQMTRRQAVPTCFHKGETS